eukprot:404957-Pyramimonas_sp.AAC.1
MRRPPRLGEEEEENKNRWERVSEGKAKRATRRRRGEHECDTLHECRAELAFPLRKRGNTEPREDCS